MTDNIKDILITLIKSSLDGLNIDYNPDQIQIDVIQDRQHGEYSTNIAMRLAKLLKKNPVILAQDIINNINLNSDLNNHNTVIKTIKTAGPGFINFYLYPACFKLLLNTIFNQKNNYGKTTVGAGKKIHIEFVSSNPTGPLHVGHGRGAVYGAALSDLLEAAGFTVHREYYVNDHGRQMDILTASIYLRYLELCGEKFEFPLNGYQGDYIKDIAQIIYTKYHETFFYKISLILKNTPDNTEENKETYIDVVINNIQQVLNTATDQYKIIFNIGLDYILDNIKQDLAEFGIHYQAWFSEKQLWQNQLAEEAIEKFAQKNYLYTKDGAVWFKSTLFGDDKDRVIKRENGQYTYFASDIAYHALKFKHYDDVIDVLGADHHGYIPRLKAIIQALGYPVEKFHAPIVQFAVLYRGKERVSMSTRSGSFVTLRELREEIGKDAARFFYIFRKADQHMDFDLELAKSNTNENPVFYIQYAYARICSIFRQLAEKQLTWGQKEQEIGLASLNLLDSDIEKDLFLMLARYKDVIMLAAVHYEPHGLAHYLRDLAESFHRYYNHCVFLVTDNPTLRHTRLCLIEATRQILSNGLHLLSVSAPESM